MFSLKKLRKRVRAYFKSRRKPMAVPVNRNLRQTPIVQRGDRVTSVDQNTVNEITHNIAARAATHIDNVIINGLNNTNTITDNSSRVLDVVVSDECAGTWTNVDLTNTDYITLFTTPTAPNYFYEYYTQMNAPSPRVIYSGFDQIVAKTNPIASTKITPEGFKFPEHKKMMCLPD